MRACPPPALRRGASEGAMSDVLRRPRPDPTQAPAADAALLPESKGATFGLRDALEEAPRAPTPQQPRPERCFPRASPVLRMRESLRSAKGEQLDSRGGGGWLRGAAAPVPTAGGLGRVRSCFTSVSGYGAWGLSSALPQGAPLLGFVRSDGQIRARQGNRCASAPGSAPNTGSMTDNSSR